MMSGEIQETDPTTTELVNKLKEIGLDPEYWLPVIDKLLGIKNIHSLQYIQAEEDFSVLEEKFRFNWERRALRKLFNIPERSLNTTQLQERQNHLLKEKNEQASKLLTQLNKLKTEGKSQHDEKFREMLTSCSMRPEKSVLEQVHQSEKKINIKEESYLKKKNLEDENVIKGASGGLALEGIFQTKNTGDLFKKREALLCVPEGFKLVGPEKSSFFQQKEFTSHQEELIFQRIVEKAGLSLSSSLTAVALGFGVQVTHGSKSSESDTLSKQASEYAYVCTTRYNYVPLASYYFTEDQLRISKAALSALKDIQKLISNNINKQILATKCAEFFQRFGSHVNHGPIHFGGILWWKASMEGIVGNLHKAKEMLSEALNFYASIGYVGSEQGIDLSEIDSQSSIDLSNIATFEKCIQVSVTKTGGPSEADSLSQWKSGLVTSKKTWSVIDRGLQLIPIWKIIVDNHKEEFTDGSKLASCLIEHYKLETGLNTEMMVGEYLATVLEKVNQFLQEVKYWNVDGATQHLKALADFKQTLDESTKGYSVWVTLCLSDKGLQDFLVSVVQKYRYNSAEETSMIKNSLQVLVGPHIYSAKNVTNVLFIMRWIYDFETNELDPAPISDFRQLCDVLHKSVEDFQQLNVNLESPTEEEHKTKVKATVNIGLALSSYLRNMREMKQSDTELLILCIAKNSGFSAGNSSFQSLLGYRDIVFLKNQLQEAYAEYTSLKSHSVHRAQAFVIYTGLASAGESREISLEQKRECLNLMRNHLSDNLSSDVDAIIQQYSGFEDWSEMESHLKSFSFGSVISTTKEPERAQIAKELNDICHKEADVETDSHKMTFFLLLKRLDLAKCYPQKMQISDFHKICRYSLEETERLEEKQLPFYFLQKLLALDCSARYVHCKHGNDSLQQTSDDDVNRDTSDDFEQFIDDSNESTKKSKSASEQTIHPMDVQMAVFHCANDFMRQYISNKLSFCQFALPLLVPNPGTNSIEFPLWSFQEVKKKWKTKIRDHTKNDKTEEKLIKGTKTQFVSFIRLGQSSSSKSQIMNWLMSKQRHNIFYHRHCQGATKNPVLTNGIVEIAWYCPGGKKDDVFDDCIAFTNLHGDAREYDKQFRFLEQVSSVIVVLFIDADTKDKKGKEVLQHLFKSPVPLICLLVDKEHSHRATGSKVKIGIRNRNQAELLEEIRTAIQSLLTKSQAKLSLNNCTDIARTCGFLVDEDGEECKQGEQQARLLLSLIRQKEVSDIKKEFLLLQGDLWHKWCIKDKEMTRLKGQSHVSIEQQRSNINSQKQMIRKQQVEKAFPFNDFMRSFYKALQSDVQGSKMHFLQWFKMCLDDLSSQTLSALYQEYHNRWSKLREEKQQRKNIQTIADMENDLEKLSEQISISTFGLEHILRELGQIYEALETSNEKNNICYTLPKIAADLMVSGHPVELMDGDATHVPLRWVGAVMNELIEILGDKRLYVLSVLGIQSTGKSTLLNAMFGLQFAVSAGRCTRGAFMQLIKIDEELTHEMNFDYVLVIDTEGLRALEQKKTSMIHDNELATFVIGLGNLTLINIFGENPSEMQDILQIAVQAFLRMKEVNLQPSCIFVHQNVGEVTAEEKNMEGQRRLQRKLDEMTHCAAQQEQCDVTCFNDVIKFDVNTHIHYFAHLWDGDPPMAPPNPSYSQNVQTLKQVILGSGKMEKQQHLLSISQFKKRIEDLWKALLNENFVFSFKNSLEIAAYDRVEKKYSQWTWTLRKHMLALQNKVNNQISNNKMKSVDVMCLRKEFEPMYSSILKDCKEFFDDEKDKDILVQWSVSTENRLATVLEDLIEDIRKKADELIRAKQNNEKVLEMKEKYVDEMLGKSRDMALSLKGKNITEEKLEDIFSEMWDSLIGRVTREIRTPKPPEIDKDLQNVFLDRFKRESNLINTIHNSREWTNLPEEFSKYISSKPKHSFGNVTHLSEKLSTDKKRKIDNTTRDLSWKVDRYIDRKRREKVDYQSVYFHEILNILQSEISNMLGSGFRFLREYSLYASLFFCRKAAHKFLHISEAFRKASDPCVYLQSKRNELWQSFRISCEETKQIASLADFLCDKLSGSIQLAVFNTSAIQLAGELQGNHPALNGNRSKLEFSLLRSLAEKENFSHYMDYITDPKSAVSDFIMECIDQYCDANPKMLDILNNNVVHFGNLVWSAINESTAEVTDKRRDISSWLDAFCSQLGSDMNLSSDDLKSVKYQGISDVGFIKEAMMKALDIVVKELKHDFSTSDLRDLMKKTHEILIGQFPGCWKPCPFCRAVCTNTIPDHDGDHSVKFHRPRGVSGDRWYKTDHFTIEICTSLVSSDVLFVRNKDQIPYKTYKNAGLPYSTWSITPDNSSLSYWKWVTCRFQSELEECYQLRFAGKGEIPQQWRNITKAEAILEIEGLI